MQNRQPKLVFGAGGLSQQTINTSFLINYNMGLNQQKQNI
jgi:hypothetical protein